MLSYEWICSLSENFVKQLKLSYVLILILDVSLSMFGSSVTGLGLKTADLNMDLVLPTGANPAICLSNVFRTLSQSGNYKDTLPS